MADPDDLKGTQDFMQMFSKVKDFTDELMKENERLRFKVASLESRAAGGPMPDQQAGELQQRIRDLEERLR